MDPLDPPRLSLLAIASLVMALLATGAFVILSVWPLGLLAVAMAAVAIVQCRRYEWTGKPFALGSLVLASATLVVAPAWHLHLYRSECPSDHVRLDFAKVMRGAQPSIETYVGRAICVKGYVWSRKWSGPPEDLAITVGGGSYGFDGGENLKKEAIRIDLTGDVPWDDLLGPVAVSGTLVPNPDAETNALAPRLRLIRASVRPSRTWYDLASGAGGC